MLPCVCSVIDHRGRQNVARTSVTLGYRLVCHYFFLSSFCHHHHRSLAEFSVVTQLRTGHSRSMNATGAKKVFFWQSLSSLSLRGV